MPEYRCSPRCFICWSLLPYKLDGSCCVNEMRYSIMRDCWNYVLLVNAVVYSRKLLPVHCRSILVEFSVWLPIHKRILISLPWDELSIFLRVTNWFSTYSSMPDFIYFRQVWFILLQPLMLCAVSCQIIYGLVPLMLLTHRWYRFHSSSSYGTALFNGFFLISLKL